ncbi:hypothetical protein [Ligilactobacillus murinus]|uniref:hypothetical protein n=1 Tax=Ligilactobacillus murinus TaxID=1622 RepID=UPI001094B340|nr:hypothetical protein [Ligilactobacillus murinus]TGY52046.1 hypothetical protein E5341_07925 [Ligilactobacillus murinus]
MKISFRQILYRYAQILTYNKLENSITIFINGFLLMILYVGFSAHTLPVKIIPYVYRDKLLTFYVITTIMLVLSRIFWRWYHQQMFAGAVEVISNYVNVIVITILIGWLTKIDAKTLIVGITIVILFNIVIYVVRLLGSQKIPMYMLFSVVILAVVTTFLYSFTRVDIFIKISFIPMACILSSRIIPYWLMLDTPYRRNLIKEFGPKDIDKSAIFVSKKKSK